MKTDTKNTPPESQEEEWTLPVMDSSANLAETPGAWTAFAIGAVTKQVNEERENLVKHLDKV